MEFLFIDGRHEDIYTYTYNNNMNLNTILFVDTLTCIIADIYGLTTNNTPSRAQSEQHVEELLSHILIGLDPGPQLLNFIFLLQEELFESFTLILFLLHSNLG